MSRRVLCKFFAQGACLKGERCDYSHDCKAPPKNVCTFYQKGACTYGSRCRYEHVRLSQLQSPGLSSSAELSACGKLASGTTSLGEGINGGDSADRPLCSFAAAGECRRGVNCPRIHGDICSNCGKQCLHPFRPKEREEHLKSCEKKQKHMKALEHSQEIECNICFEGVLSKPTTAERKFGILSECDHPFCISCIRSWRSRSPLYGADAHSTTRSCPLCRKLSYFVIPSAVWYSSKEEKQEIVDNYKAKLRSIDCKHFSFGNGNCPFGSSCFYKHTVKPGSLFWNATHYPDFHNARDWDENELESTSDAFDMLGLQDLMERFNSTRNPTDDEQFDDGDSAEDLDDMMGEMMVLLSVLQDVDSSDSDDFY